MSTVMSLPVSVCGHDAVTCPVAQQGQTAFPPPICLGGKHFQFQIWDGQPLPDRLLAYDTETAKIQEREIPPLALATVYGDAGSAYLLHPDQLAAFIRQHSQRFFCAHNAVFDFWVTAQHLQAEPDALAAWWGIAGDGRLCCTMLLDELISLARSDAEPISRGLGVVANEYCGLALDKNDPYRLRYAELIGVPVADWPAVEPGFFTYACKDPVATFQVMRVEAKIAQELIEPYEGELLPETLRRFGPLTACLQTQGAIALDFISRGGIGVDLQQARQLHAAVDEIVTQNVRELERLGGQEIFKRYKKTGAIQLTKSGAPRRNAKVIKARLEQIARAAAEPIEPPRLKDETVTDAGSYWAQHKELDPFITVYVQLYEQSNLLKFFKALNQDRVYPTYRPLVRTGRTSCSDPNLQQMPRDSRFREMIVAPPGYWLLQIDYSVLELRTLAQICLRRFGRSKLAELFRDGLDPHRYTAALLLGMTLEQFGQLPAKEQKQHRQRAKAINFGVPGGLGAASLVSYAKHGYGVEMTLEEAQQFRQKLITQVYPELSAYLQDHPHADLAANLHCIEAAVQHAFPQQRQVNTAYRIVSGELRDQDGKRYKQDVIDHVWQTLQKLNGNPRLQGELQTRRSSTDLARQIFWGHAVTISGRRRGQVGYTQRANSPFQALAADGNKLALFRLLRAGYRVCGFIHDEMLVLIPDGVDYDSAVARVQQILQESMQELTPSIPIKTEYLLADRWYKDVDQQPRDDAGRIMPYRRQAKGQVSGLVV